MDDDRVIASDEASRNLFSLATRVAQTDTTVLLTGESGVGKEVVARYLHNHSARRAGPELDREMFPGPFVGGL